MYGFISGLFYSILFYWSVCLSLYQYYTTYVLKPQIPFGTALCSSLSGMFCPFWTFAYSYKFWNHVVRFHGKPHWDTFLLPNYCSFTIIPLPRWTNSTTCSSSQMVIFDPLFFHVDFRIDLSRTTNNQNNSCRHTDWNFIEYMNDGVGGLPFFPLSIMV